MKKYEKTDAVTRRRGDAGRSPRLRVPASPRLFFSRRFGEVLMVGPYIGTVGCLEIPIGRGVCGTAAAQRKTVIVPDVQKFPGHIACDPRSRSEIVVPVFGRDDDLIAVLDVDSDRLAAFDQEDQAGLEPICALFRNT